MTFTYPFAGPSNCRITILMHFFAVCEISLHGSEGMLVTTILFAIKRYYQTKPLSCRFEVEVLAEFVFFLSEDSTRVFICLRIEDKSDKFLEGLLNEINHLMKSFKLRPYFEVPFNFFFFCVYSFGNNHMHLYRIIYSTSG